MLLMNLAHSRLDRVDTQCCLHRLYFDPEFGDCLRVGVALQPEGCCFVILHLFGFADPARSFGAMDLKYLRRKYCLNLRFDRIFEGRPSFGYSGFGIQHQANCDAFGSELLDGH